MVVLFIRFHTVSFAHSTGSRLGIEEEHGVEIWSMKAGRHLSCD